MERWVLRNEPQGIRWKHQAEWTASTNYKTGNDIDVLEKWRAKFVAWNVKDKKFIMCDSEC